MAEPSIKRWTIADLDGSIGVDVAHIEEAAWYRSPIVKHAALAS